MNFLHFLYCSKIQQGKMEMNLTWEMTSRLSSLGMVPCPVLRQDREPGQHSAFITSRLSHMFLLLCLTASWKNNLPFCIVTNKGFTLSSKEGSSLDFISSHFFQRYLWCLASLSLFFFPRNYLLDETE